MKRQVLFRLDEDTLWSLKALCVQQRKPMQVVLEEAVANLLGKKPKSPSRRKPGPKPRKVPELKP